MSYYWSFILGVALMAAMAVVFSGGNAAAEDAPLGKKGKGERVYELRTYYCLPGRLDALHTRFREHTTKLFEKHGMKNEMYWTPTDPKLKDHTLIYVISHDSAEAAKKSWEGFRSDPEWLKVRDASEKDGKIVDKVDSVYMTATDFSPGKQ